MFRCVIPKIRVLKIDNHGKCTPNDPNVDTSAIVPAPANPEHAPAQPVGLGNGFAPHWIGSNIPNNQNGWIEEDPEEEEEDPEEEEEDPEEEEEYLGEEEEDSEEEEEDSEEEEEDSEEDPEEDPEKDPKEDPEEDPEEEPEEGDDEEKEMEVDDEENNSEMKDMEKFMMERIDTEGRMKKKFKEQDRHFVGLGCDNIEIDRTVRKVMSNLSGVKKLVKGLSDRFNEYERSKVFKDKKILEKELVNERKKDFYREFVRKPPAEPFARSAPALRSDDPYVVARDAAAAVTTSDIHDDDDTASMDSQPYEPRGSPRDSQTMPPKRSLRGDPPPPLTQETINRMIQESVEAAIRTERERDRNEANRVGGPNVAYVARKKQKKIEASNHGLSEKYQKEKLHSLNPNNFEQSCVEGTLYGKQKVKAKADESS
ncbi:hypothetical protein Tco_0562449 [Tanacetum coccineum]